MYHSGADGALRHICLPPGASGLEQEATDRDLSACYVSAHGLDGRVKKIDAMRAEIVAATQSVGGVDQLGRQLAAKHPEYRAHIQNGMSFEDVGQSHLEEQIRVYLAYSLDRGLWQELVEKSERFSHQDPNAMAPMFSPWGYLHSDLTENIGDGLGWTYGSDPRNLAGMGFPERMRLFVNGLEGLNTQQLLMFEKSLGLEEGVAPQKTGGCYVATAVYGSYEAPEVMVLRRWRDEFLAYSALGRQFIRIYYATSPALVEAFGGRQWFVVPSRAMLDRVVRNLERRGY